MKTKTYIAKTRSGIGEHLCVFSVGIIIAIFISGCFDKGRSTFKEANDFFNRGDYRASLSSYDQIIKKYPDARDRVLFEMGIIYAYPGNEQKDYQKSLECFQKLIRDYPRSDYRKDSEMMIFNINNVTLKDRMIAAQQKQIENLRQTQIETLQRGDKTIAAQQEKIETLLQEIKSRGDEIISLQKKTEAFEKKILVQKGPANKIVIEKKERRMTLMSKGEVLKAYKIALGGNPIGPKERQGDKKTPEGTYVIDSRNKDSHYHISLHISYPNERDRQRARELGVSPGGDIMIHGMKPGFSWAGESHTKVDWTEGCIAVTDEEIEEIEKLVPNGTIVEIRP